MITCNSQKIYSFFLSFVAFPSCMFWTVILLPLVRYSMHTTKIFISSQFNFSNIPNERSMYNNKQTAKSMVYFEIVYIIAISVVLYYMRKKFIKAMNHSAPIAIIKFKKYTKRFVLPAILYVFSLIGKLVTATYDNSTLYCFCTLVYLVSLAACLYLYNIMFMIKECALHPLGHYIDYLLIIIGTTYLPLLFLSNFYDNSVLNSVYSYTEIIFSTLLVFKYSFVSMHVLGKKFLRCSELYV